MEHENFLTRISMENNPDLFESEKVVCERILDERPEFSEEFVFKIEAIKARLTEILDKRQFSLELNTQTKG